MTWVICQNFPGGDDNGAWLWRTKGWGSFRQLRTSELPIGDWRMEEGKNAGFP